MPGGRPSKYDPSFCDRVIELGREGASLTEIAADIGVVRDTIYAWIDNYDEFFDAMKKASELSQAFWERMGREGTTGKISGFNALSYIFQMKNRFPRDWRDRKEVEQNHNINTERMITSITHRIIDPGRLDLDQLSVEELESLQQLYEKQKTKVIEHKEPEQ